MTYCAKSFFNANGTFRKTNGRITLRSLFRISKLELVFMRAFKCDAEGGEEKLKWYFDTKMRVNLEDGVPKEVFINKEKVVVGHTYEMRAGKLL
jgi:hypothetical protein